MLSTAIAGIGSFALPLPMDALSQPSPGAELTAGANVPRLRKRNARARPGGGGAGPSRPAAERG